MRFGCLPIRLSFHDVSANLRGPGISDVVPLDVARNGKADKDAEHGMASSRANAAGEVPVDLARLRMLRSVDPSRIVLIASRKETPEHAARKSEGCEAPCDVGVQMRATP